MALDAVRLAVGTFTALPAGAVRVNRRTAGRAMMLAPLAVLPVAVPAVGLGWAAHVAGAAPLLAGLVVVAALMWGTRALHADGLADTADGLGSGRPPAQALEIMRRGDTGPMGVVALVLVLSGQAVALGSLVTDWRGALTAALLVMLSRAAATLLCVEGVPAARPEGLGTAVAGSVPPAAAVLCWSAGLGLLALLSWLLDGQEWRGPLVGAAALVALAVLLRRARRRLGGVTGDVVGAGIELALVVLVVGMSL